jgi:hypothetical protein
MINTQMVLIKKSAAASIPRREEKTSKWYMKFFSRLLSATVLNFLVIYGRKYTMKILCSMMCQFTMVVTAL